MRIAGELIAQTEHARIVLKGPGVVLEGAQIELIEFVRAVRAGAGRHPHWMLSVDMVGYGAAPLAVAPSLDIAANLFLGRERRRKGVLGSVFRMLDRNGMREEARRQLDALARGEGDDVQAQAASTGALGGDPLEDLVALLARGRASGAHGDAAPPPAGARHVRGWTERPGVLPASLSPACARL
mgnify:CR=1 FL=1